MNPAVVIVCREGEHFLAIRRAECVSRPGFWSPPSGRVEPGETPAQAVVREAFEELGLEVRAERELWTCPTDDARYQLHWWLARIVSGEIKPNPDEVAEVVWMDAHQFLAAAPIFPAHREFFLRVWPQVLALDQSAAT